MCKLWGSASAKTKINYIMIIVIVVPDFIANYMLCTAEQNISYIDVQVNLFL